MGSSTEKNHKQLLHRIAVRAMLEKGLLPDFPQNVLTELSEISGPGQKDNNSIRDQRNILWCSIDNDDSRDLDQLSAAEQMQDGTVKIYVAIADVDSIVKNNSAIDRHARHNTTSVYTSGGIFSMLPEKLSTDYTSLNFKSDRLSIVIEMIIDSEGSLLRHEIYRSLVYNYAKLAYNSVASWLEGKTPVPDEIAAVHGLDENIRLQNAIAQKMRAQRYVHGALDLETIEAHFVFSDNSLQNLEEVERNEAKEIIQDFMIAANGATARFLEQNNRPSIRRVVRIPKRWDKIIEVAAQYGFKLPIQPDPLELNNFLAFAKTNEPIRFPDLSLTVIKLLGSGEYTVEVPGGKTEGHFGLAVKDYTHSTAPNRRYPDLITQRLLKAVLSGSPSPYSIDELNELALHCGEMEDLVRKVERRVQKSAAAMLLENRIGEQFEAIVTGVSEKGTWVRLLQLPVEGRLMHGFEGMDVGNKTHVQLIDLSVEKGYIDFERSI
jgi:exoribonuclease-2